MQVAENGHLYLDRKRQIEVVDLLLFLAKAGVAKLLDEAHHSPGKVFNYLSSIFSFELENCIRINRRMNKHSGMSISRKINRSWKVFIPLLVFLGGL